MQSSYPTQYFSSYCFSSKKKKCKGLGLFFVLPLAPSTTNAKRRRRCNNSWHVTAGAQSGKSHRQSHYMTVRCCWNGVCHCERRGGKNSQFGRAQSTEGTGCQGRKSGFTGEDGRTCRGHPTPLGGATHTLAANHVQEQNKHGEPGRGRGQRRSSPAGPDYKAPGSCTGPANSLRTGADV